MAREEWIVQLPCLGDWLRWATARFEQAELHFGHGTDNAWDEAVQLILQSLHLDIHSDDRVLDRHLNLKERREIFDLVERRIQERIPLPYLTHEAWFMGLSFYVDERVLIPRSPLGEWIERKFEPWLLKTPRSILDIGTGSACIAIACASVFQEARVDAVDISAEALAVARMNVERHHLQERVHLHHSDCFEALESNTYDLILSNPPYVSKAELQDLPPEYAHEPLKALEAEAEGLEIVLRILQEAPAYLKRQGILVMDVGYSDALLMERLPKVPFTWLELERGGHGIFVLTCEQLTTIEWH